jgi:hypothetical protein
MHFLLLNLMWGTSKPTIYQIVLCVVAVNASLKLIKIHYKDYSSLCVKEVKVIGS